jgi:lipopolysaccharide assembly protein B
MQASTWWLLAIPILFALGWVAAKLDSAQLLTRTHQLPESYFKGLNFLLNEQHEQAIKAFEEVARLDPEIADLYFALGNLFRRRGETERSIRIHRNLLERADLPETSRQQALFCLGQDYLNAGIFDRAEAAFSSLDNTDYALQAQRELAKLHEKESNWQAAIDCLKCYQTQIHQQAAKPLYTIANANDDCVNEDLSHYACELAQHHLANSNTLDAKTMLDLAASSFSSNPRIAFYQAQLTLLLAQPNAETALNETLEQLDRVLDKQVNLTGLAIQTVQGALSNQLSYTPNAPQLSILKRWANHYPTAEVVASVLPLLHTVNDTAGQVDLLHSLAQQLKHSPQRLASANVLLIHSLNPEYAEYTSSWQAQAASAIDALVKRIDKPMCKQCGFKSSRHQWRCAGCGKWNTLPYSQD